MRFEGVTELKETSLSPYPEREGIILKDNNKLKTVYRMYRMQKEKTRKCGEKENPTLKKRSFTQHIFRNIEHRITGWLKKGILKKEPEGMVFVAWKLVLGLN